MSEITINPEVSNAIRVINKSNIGIRIRSSDYYLEIIPDDNCKIIKAPHNKNNIRIEKHQKGSLQVK